MMALALSLPSPARWLGVDPRGLSMGAWILMEGMAVLLLLIIREDIDVTEWCSVVTETIRCRTRPYYYLRSAMEHWRLNAVLMVIGVVGALAIGAPALAAGVCIPGAVATGWAYLDDMTVVYEERDRS